MTVQSNAGAIDTSTQERHLEFYRQHIRPGDICFDVGANVGDKTEIFLALGAVVVAFEPQADCVATMRRRLGKRQNLTIEACALGEQVATSQIMICEQFSTISSMSPEWINAVKRSGRFAKGDWNRAQTVTVATLDSMIRKHGLPSFIKIDVEGYEYQVLRGLNRRVPVISIEFTPELFRSTVHCIHRMAGLGEIELNCSLEDSMAYVLPQWVGPLEMCRVLSGFGKDRPIWGDVYIRAL